VLAGRSRLFRSCDARYARTMIFSSNSYRKLEVMTPDGLEPYIEALHSDTERRSIAEQIIDHLLAEDESRYKLYEDVWARATTQYCLRAH